MKFTSTKQTLIGFTVFLTILALGSCGIADDTAPPGAPPDYMSFTLTNRSGTTIYSTNELSRGSTYGLVITPASGTTIPTADYVVTYSPTTAITGIATNTNSIDFTVNNTTDISVTVTVTHKTDSSISETVTLNLAPQDYMSFALTNLIGGPTIDPTTQLFRGNNYRLTITPGSGVVPATADYVVTHTPVAAITTNVVRPNSVDFTVNNTADRAVTFTVTHRTVSAISETITLNLAPQVDYMSFALTNRSGTPVTTTTQLSRGSTYGLVITPGSGVMPATADYTITYTPATAITTNVVRPNSVDFTVNNTTDISVTVTVAHRTVSAIRETVTLNFIPQIVTTFQQNIENATTVPNLIIANALTRAVLEPLNVATGTTLVKRYVTQTGGATTRDGTSWATAWAAANLRANINAISDATANRVYLVMIAGGTYKPTTTTTRTVSFGMKNHVAIMGGFDPVGGWGRTGTTIFSGDIGVVGNNGDNSYHVFFHNSIPLGNAHLYGVTIINGNGTGTLGTVHVNGGGMYNNGSSPVLTEVVFSGNTATIGGGMYNNGSSPLLTEVVFSGNAAAGGGGMYNDNSSSPVLTNVVFSGNSSPVSGGGMYNDNSSSPVLIEVEFSRNTATTAGGGMYNTSSSPVLTNVEFSGNTAGNQGGGMYNTSSSPVLTEVVFSGNAATSTVGNGGGMYNISSSLVLTEVEFSGNTATDGGGMYNTSSSSVLTKVIFSGNTATRTGGTGGYGGGMYNISSSLVLTEVVFSRNSTRFGGGMYNDTSAPVLTRAVFINNSAVHGGGMYNDDSAPVLTSVVFSENTATRDGGGMLNYASSSVLIGAVFINNTAANGGGMWNDNGNASSGPLIVNSIFSGNNVTGNGPDIAVDRDGVGTLFGTENIRIAGSVLGINLAQPTNGVVGYSSGGRTAAINIEYHSLANGAVRFGADATLTINGMNFPYPTITTGSSAINRGLYVRRNGGTYYFSETEAVTSWHTSFTSTGGLAGTPASLPTTGTTENLTATDIAGNARNGRPDAGVYELP